MDTSKPASKSKTLWFNLIGAVFVTLEAFTGALHGVMSDTAYFALLAVSIGGNAALRYFTSQAIGKTND
ncbi:hypothetical protein [Nitrosovibrio sp. Nv6]|uniref:hypothetical protein n=1 Tax=Nitrosovibrio sp. Nv6 TaxID=1855340 RepID=UPI0008CC3D45|nr:hypothetical protein [Nitrosovibrio sp. Nv6]SEO77238.1 hypothetical protein SAMN05216316_1050 [Nitrosovibrio sp. Nv6]